ncbi:MAG: ATP phosphoribosyltransferase regulatory subunit, partial [Pseudomonadota bacterium]
MSRADAAFEEIAVRGGSLSQVPVVIEAAVPLELSGEVVRNRICTFTDEQGQEWALRPDLTLPVAQAEIVARQTGAPEETVRRYRGPVFRLPAVMGEPVEYEQIGIERFGAARGVEEDVWLFETIAAGCRAAGTTSGAALFGDLSIFPAFVDALDIQTDLAAGLKRAFRQEGGVRAFMAGHNRQRGGLSSRLKGMAQTEVAAFVEDIFAMTSVRPVGERSAEEIVERLYQQAQAAELTLSQEASALLEAVLAVDAPIEEAPIKLRAIADQAGLNGLGETLDRFEQRMQRLLAGSASTFLSGAQFATRFGRRFTYYDGFVFELIADHSAAARKRPFASGG